MAKHSNGGYDPDRQPSRRTPKNYWDDPDGTYYPGRLRLLKRLLWLEQRVTATEWQIRHPGRGSSR